MTKPRFAWSLILFFVASCSVSPQFKDQAEQRETGDDSKAASAQTDELRKDVPKDLPEDSPKEVPQDLSKDGPAKKQDDAEPPIDNGVKAPLPPIMPAPKLAQPLPIGPRLQWDNDNGYCGETSIQSIGLYYGAWISQQTVRELAGGEVLLGVNIDKALKALKFSYETWNSSQNTPQYNAYMSWVKSRLLAKTPVIFTVYLKGSNDADYDHIVPAFGIKEANSALSGYQAKDELYFYTLYSTTPIIKSFDALAGTRASCNSTLAMGGCIPRDTNYGVAIKGFLDAQAVSRPVRLTVNFMDESNLSQNEKPRAMIGKVLVESLEPGKKYALLRFNGYSTVPTTGTAATFLNASPEARVDFTASSSEWTYTDPKMIPSNESVYYRAVPVE